MSPDDLSAEDVHDVLSNRRRRLVLETLRSNGGAATARELSERIAEAESGETPPPRNIRQSAYVSLHQTHLPKLNQLDIIDYDEQAKTVTLTDNESDVTVYLETVPKYGLSWSEFYVATGVLAIITLIAASIGVPLLSAVSVTDWAMFFFGIIVIAGSYHTYRQGSSVISRLRG